MTIQKAQEFTLFCGDCGRRMEYDGTRDAHALFGSGRMFSETSGEEYQFVAFRCPGNGWLRKHEDKFYPLTT